MFNKLHLIATTALFLFGCAAQPPVTKAPIIGKYPSPAPPVHQEPIIEKDPFQGFPEKYRLKAIELGKGEELRKALFYWKVVRNFTPDDADASERIEVLEARIRTESEKHFLRGLNYSLQSSIQAARKEFLIALTYNPEHVQALDYLKHKLNDPDYLLYESKGGETLKRISQDIYKDPEKDFLIAYFNDLESRDPLKPGMALKLPIVASAWMAKPTYSEERLNKSDSLPKTRKLEVQWQEQAEVHYAKGVRHFLAEELDNAIQEWEETLRLNPDHSKAKKDLQRTRRLLENLRKLQ